MMYDSTNFDIFGDLNFVKIVFFYSKLDLKPTVRRLDGGKLFLSYILLFIHIIIMHHTLILYKCIYYTFNFSTAYNMEFFSMICLLNEN